MGQNRQPSGTPSGGEFALDTKAEPLDVNLAVPAFPDDYQGDCDGCGARVGYTEDNEVVHLRKDGVADYDPTEHTPSFNPDTYVGGAVDEIAEASGWGSTKMERYEDGQAERRENAAYDIAFERGRAAASASIAGGVNLSGSAADVRTQAQQAMWFAEAVTQVAGAKAAAQDILAAYPNAAVLELDQSDQEGSSFTGGRILDAAGVHVADFDEFEEDHWGTLSDLPERPRQRTVLAEDGTFRDEADAGFAFMSWDGSRRMGYTGRIDLKAAAGVNLKDPA